MPLEVATQIVQDSGLAERSAAVNYGALASACAGVKVVFAQLKEILMDVPHDCRLERAKTDVVPLAVTIVGFPSALTQLCVLLARQGLRLLSGRPLHEPLPANVVLDIGVRAKASGRFVDRDVVHAGPRVFKLRSRRHLREAEHR